MLLLTLSLLLLLTAFAAEAVQLSCVPQRILQEALPPAHQCYYRAVVVNHYSVYVEYYYRAFKVLLV